MTSIDTVVIGAGHAGLSVSRLLTRAGCPHVVLDRGRVGERWRSERWDSLRLLTPNWMTRLPDRQYTGRDPDGFMSATDLVEVLEQYAGTFDVPVLTGTSVLEVSATADDYRVVTDQGTWRARRVVIATGPHGKPHVPPGLRTTEVLTANHYRNPGQLAPGGVLVVGASASGVQIADELARAGREVVLAVGRHTRLPRSYRGLDVFWWLEATGRLARTIDDVPDPVAARHETSLQLVGRNHPMPGDRDLDLGTLQARGVRLAATWTRSPGTSPASATTWPAPSRPPIGGCTGSSTPSTGTVLETGLTDEVWSPDRPRPVPVTSSPTRLDLRAERIGTVLLATGFVPDHPWLRLPITEPDGSIRQRRGVTPAPGVYVVGQRFQHRRDSGFIDGARRDARDVVAHLLGQRTAAIPSPRAPVGSARHEPLRRGRGRSPGRRVGHRAAARPGRAPGGRGRARRLRQRHGLDARPDAGRRPAAVALGAARPGRRSGDAAGATDHLPLRRRRAGGGVDQAQPGVDALYAPRRRVLDPIIEDAAAEAGAHVLHGVTVTGLLRDDAGRVRGVHATGPRARSTSGRR
jgi:putative flavoprotein involved in K+ transport